MSRFFLVQLNRVVARTQIFAEGRVSCEVVLDMVARLLQPNFVWPFGPEGLWLRYAMLTNLQYGNSGVGESVRLLHVGRSFSVYWTDQSQTDNDDERRRRSPHVSGHHSPCSRVC